MRWVSEHTNALIFGVGFIACAVGMAAYSGALAAVVAGAILMLVAAYPYLRRAPKG